jgi:hypothetical protein
VGLIVSKIRVKCRPFSALWAVPVKQQIISLGLVGGKKVFLSGVVIVVAQS